MKYILITFLTYVYAYASINNINSFKADFTQIITDDKNKKLHYNGRIIASKPQNAKWTYTQPVNKIIYINKQKAIIIEPEIEQVIKRKIQSNFDFFKIINKAKKINKNKYSAMYNNTFFTIKVKNNTLLSISYLDQFENNVDIVFKNQIQNEIIDKSLFIPKYPSDFDIIKD